MITPYDELTIQVSRFPLFYELSQKIIEQIIRKFHKKQYESGEVIVEEGTVGDKFYLLISGRVQASTRKSGEEVILSYMEAGEGFGELALLEENKMRQATITAVRPTVLLELSREDFKDMIEKYPLIEKGIKKLEKQRVSLSEDFIQERKLKLHALSLEDKKVSLSESFVQELKSLLIPKFETDEMPVLELLFRINEATGGKEQLDHCKETAMLGKEMCNILCPYLGEEVQFAAYLHEVGKISLDENLIKKHREGKPLTDKELEKIKEYPEHTFKIVSAIESLKDEMNLIKYLGEEDYRSMPVGTQILKVANDYQEMVNPAYLGLTRKEALKRIHEKSGSSYNPQVVIALEKILEKVKSRHIKWQLLYMDIIHKALDSKDAYTGKHSRDTTRIALAIGKKMNLNKNELDDLELAGRLHDIGKIKVPESILNAPRKLVPWEFEVIKTHPVESARFFEDMPGFEEIAKIIKYHHEKYTGGGYPEGLSGEAIPLFSRILAVADVFSALTTPRVYRLDEKGQRKAFTKEKALEIMEEMEGHFDPEIFKVFKEIVPEL